MRLRGNQQRALLLKMADFQIFRNSVRATSSLDIGGTQSIELEAKIKSVTSSTTISSCFIYDTRSDSDGGAWRKKCAGLSWYDEAESATRSARSEFPSVALIVADNASPATVTIYDLDDPAMPMWIVFNNSSPAWETNATFVSTNSVSSVYALNARLYVGGANGFIDIDFGTEQQTNFRPISSTQSPDECEKILSMCAEKYPIILPLITLNLFCGIRPSECRRLNTSSGRNSNLRWEDKEIVMQALKSKTKMCRTVEMSDNCLAEAD